MIGLKPQAEGLDKPAKHRPASMGGVGRRATAATCKAAIQRAVGQAPRVSLHGALHSARGIDFTISACRSRAQQTLKLHLSACETIVGVTTWTKKCGPIPTRDLLCPHAGLPLAFGPHRARVADNCLVEVLSTFVTGPFATSKFGAVLQLATHAYSFRRCSSTEVTRISRRPSKTHGVRRCRRWRSISVAKRPYDHTSKAKARPNATGRSGHACTAGAGSRRYPRPGDYAATFAPRLASNT